MKCVHQTSLVLTVLLRAEGVLVFSLEVGGDAAPELSITAALGDAGVIGLPHEHEGKHTRLAI